MDDWNSALTLNVAGSAGRYMNIATCFFFLSCIAFIYKYVYVHAKLLEHHSPKATLRKQRGGNV